MERGPFLQRHSLAVFFFLAFLISWAGSFFVAGPKFLQGDPFTFDDILLMRLWLLVGPSIAGVSIALLVDGTSGLRNLLARMANWRVGWRWYGVLLVLPILLTVVSIVLNVLVSPKFILMFLSPSLLVFLLMGLFAGALEEIGWMGFAYPELELKVRALNGSIYLGFIWGIWHLLPDFLRNSANLGPYWLPYFIAFLLFVMALRVLIVWVYTNTKSLLLSQLMHASSIGLFSFLIPMILYVLEIPMIFYGVYALLLWIVVALIIMKYGTNLRVGLH